MQLQAERLDHIAKLERLYSEKNKEIVQNWLDRVVKSYERDLGKRFRSNKN